VQPDGKVLLALNKSGFRSCIAAAATAIGLRGLVRHFNGGDASVTAKLTLML
jgi:hypothetical protein